MIHRRLSTLSILAAITVVYIPGVCNGFSLVRSSATQNAHYYTSKSTTSTSLKVLPESITGPEGAQSYFYLWFFGGSGGAGVALRQFPQQIDKFNSLRSMVSSCKIILQHNYSLSNLLSILTYIWSKSGEGPTLGGETVGISPLCLYPRDLSEKDLAKVLNNKLSVEKMVEKGPKPNFMSTKGYLCYDSFVDANKGCNPLTIRAVFDSLSTGDIVSPDVAQTKLDSFTNDPSSDFSIFKSELLKTKLAGFSSIAFLLFLLGPITGSTCLESFLRGWAPGWPGSDNLPWSLLIEPGIWTIPEYWN